MYRAVTESRESLARWFDWCGPHYTRDAAATFAAAQAGEWADGTAWRLLIVENRGEPRERVLGTVGFHSIDAVNRQAELGYWVRASARRQRVAVRAAGLALDWLFDATDIAAVSIVVAVGNEPSLGVSRALGATEHGVLPDRIWLHGEPVDAHLLRITRRDWLARERKPQRAD